MRCLGFWFGRSNDTYTEIKQRVGSHVETALLGKYSVKPLEEEASRLPRF